MQTKHEQTTAQRGVCVISDFDSAAVSVASAKWIMCLPVFCVSVCWYCKWYVHVYVCVVVFVFVCAFHLPTNFVAVTHTLRTLPFFAFLHLPNNCQQKPLTTLEARTFVVVLGVVVVVGSRFCCCCCCCCYQLDSDCS